MKLFKKIFGKQAAEETPRSSDFSEFFNHAPVKEKKKLLEEVAREANADQKNYVEKYRSAASSSE